KNPSVVMRIAVEGDPNAAQNVHWRGIALTTFDGSRWYTPVRDQNVVVANADGEYPLRLGDLSRGTFSPLHYTVLMEPIATDAIFVAARLQSIRGRFGEDSTRPDGVPRSPYLLIDQTSSLSNAAHNSIKVRYEGMSLLPTTPASELRNGSSFYPRGVREVY